MSRVTQQGKRQTANRTPRDRFVADLHAQRVALGLSVLDVVVATVLVTVWSDAGLRLVWPSQRTIAEQVGVCERSVRYSIAALERAGVLTVERHQPRQVAAGRYTRRVNRYRFMWRRLRALASQVGAVLRQRAPRGNRLPQEPPKGGQVTPVGHARAHAGGLDPPSSDPANAPRTPRTPESDAAMVAARRSLPRRGWPGALTLPLATGWTALRAGPETKGGAGDGAR